MKNNFQEYLAKLDREEEIFFYPNHGNAGDALIFCATVQLFEKLGIRFHLIKSTSFDATGKTVVYGGGGNLVAGRNEARHFIERHLETAGRLVVLHHTICGHEDLLSRLESHVDLFVREEVSYRHIQKHAPNANLFIDHDLAFNLDVQSLLAMNLPRPWNVPPKRLIRREISLLKEAHQRRVGIDRVLNCFRTDKEKTCLQIPPGNMDLAKLFKGGFSSIKDGLLASRQVLNLLNQYEEVHTNRLHMAIAGALLGKSVQFYPNSYYKCEAVYQYSMKDRFPNVRWMGDESP